MSEHGKVFSSVGLEAQRQAVLSEPCIMVVFGGTGDLTKRLLVPALYNLACDGLLSDNFALLGTATSVLTDEEFRGRFNDTIHGFHTRPEFDQETWQKLVSRIHYLPGRFDDPEHFQRLRQKADQLDGDVAAQGNRLLYCATAPSFFGTICENLYRAGFQQGDGWRRIVVEKPFGSDLESAVALNNEVLRYWDETQIYRIDHYLGKETVQNLLAFRFSNGMFEPLWNKNFIDNIQFTVAESVDVQGRGRYYDSSGVVRDMLQNHMFQMLAYLCMEPPGSFAAKAIRNEKAKLLESVRIYAADEVERYTVRGQYGPTFASDGSLEQPGYRQEPGVDPNSNTETYAAAKLHIDNWRWEGVPIYLRSGKALWKKGTEIVVQFKRAPRGIFRDTAVDHISANRLIFHMQPYQGIELLFQAKIPGPRLQLQNVDMVFNYGDSFKASRYTGYEVLLYSCTRGDSTLFSRGDLVEAAWRIAQPIIDCWAQTPAEDFPNYPRGSWGPKAASQLLERDGRRWFEVVTNEVLKRSAIFQNADSLLLQSTIASLRPRLVAAGEIIIEVGDVAHEMFLVCRGQVEVLDSEENVVETLKDGDFFGEIGILTSVRRTATVRAKTPCDLFVLDKSAFSRVLQDHPQFADEITQIAKQRYHLAVSQAELMATYL